MTDLKINIKSISNKKNKIKTTVIPCDDSITDIRGLLTEIVKYCVKTYNERMESSEILNVFTREQIEDKRILSKQRKMHLKHFPTVLLHCLLMTNVLKILTKK